MENINKSELSDKCRKAIKSFVERKGCTVLGEVEEGILGLVFKDEGDMVFAACYVGHGQFDEPDLKPLRSTLESEAVCWMFRNSDAIGAGQVRFDVISLMLASDSKALLRHHIGALYQEEEA